VRPRRLTVETPAAIIKQNVGRVAQPDRASDFRSLQAQPMLGVITYSLDTKKLEDAVGILDSELSALNSCIRVQIDANASWPVNIGQYVFLFTVAVIAILSNHRWVPLDVVVPSIAALFLVWFLVASPSTLRVFRAFIQLRRVQRDLGLDRVKWFVGWKEGGARMLRMAPFYLGILLVVSAFSKIQTGSWIRDAALIAGALCMGMSLRLVSSRALVPFERRVQETTILRSALLSKMTQATLSAENRTISLPEVEYKQIARIERALISLDRKQVVKQISTNRETSVCAVQQSVSVMRKTSALESTDRLRVQTRIDELSADPEPPDALRDSDGVSWVPVPQTSWAITYTLVGSPPRIVIHDLKSRGAG